MNDDIVAELDRWQAIPEMPLVELLRLMQRARDEIVALQTYKHTAEQLSNALVTTRDEALEEAAVMMEREMEEPICAAAIRALKNKQWERTSDE